MSQLVECEHEMQFKKNTFYNIGFGWEQHCRTCSICGCKKWWMVNRAKYEDDEKMYLEWEKYKNEASK